MTTLRELLERGQIEKVREYLLTHHNSVPLCCFQTKLFIPSTGKKRSITLFKCGWLNKYYTWKAFKKECEKCQLEMKGIISEYEIGKGDI